MSTAAGWDCWRGADSHSPAAGSDYSQVDGSRCSPAAESDYSQADGAHYSLVAGLHCSRVDGSHCSLADDWHCSRVDGSHCSLAAEPDYWQADESHYSQADGSDNSWAADTPVDSPVRMLDGLRAGMPRYTEDDSSVDGSPNCRRNRGG
jgi:hypothetical protein